MKDEKHFWASLTKNPRRLADRHLSGSASAFPSLGPPLCGTCGRKLQHRARKNSPSGDYRCYDANGRTYCGGGGISAAKAEEMVTEAFMARARFALVGPQHDAPSFQSPELTWQRASLEERRHLLSLAIDRIELTPRPGGARPRGKRTGEYLSITWRDGYKGRESAELLTFTATQPPRREEGSSPADEGRAEAYRKQQVELDEAGRRERSERSRASFREWKEHQERFRGKR
jgi:hypothetical protein